MTSRAKIARKPAVTGDRSHSAPLCWCARCIERLPQVVLENAFVWPVLLGPQQLAGQPAVAVGRRGRRTE